MSETIDSTYWQSGDSWPSWAVSAGLQGRPWRLSVCWSMDQRIESLSQCTTLMTAARGFPASLSSSSSSWHIVCCGPLRWLPSPQHDMAIASYHCVVIEQSRQVPGSNCTRGHWLHPTEWWRHLHSMQNAMSLLQVTVLLHCHRLVLWCTTTQSITLTKIVHCMHYCVSLGVVIGGPTHWWTPGGQMLEVLTPVTPAALTLMAVSFEKFATSRRM